MSSQFPSTPQVKVRTALLVFIKGASTPVALYVENPQAVYDELQQVLRAPSASLIEKEGTGPIKKLSVQANQISAVALQDEQYV